MARAGATPRGAALAGAATALATVGCGSSETSGTSADAPTTTAAPAVQGVTLRNITDEGDPVEGGKFVIGLEAETESGLNPITSQLAASGHYSKLAASGDDSVCMAASPGSTARAGAGGPAGPGRGDPGQGQPRFLQPL